MFILLGTDPSSKARRGRLIALGTVEELRVMSVAKGGLENVFLSLVDAVERAREKVRG